MTHFSLQKSVYVLIFLFGGIAGLVFAKPFLVPLAFAALLAMLLLPFNKWLERKGFKKVLAILTSLLLLLVVLGGIVWLITWQVGDIASNSTEIEKNLTEKVTALKQSISTSFGIPPQKQQEMMQKQQQGSGSKVSGMAMGFLSAVGGFLTNFLLVMVYTFLLLFSREHLKKTALKLVKPEKQAAASSIISDCSKVTQKYLSGMGLMIVGLWIMYGIGFSIVGVKNAIFFAILCGMLEIVPFVGNLAGTGVTLLSSLAQGGSSTMLIGILVTYAVVQFVQSYVLEPLVVGDNVNVNPLFTIVGIIAAELIWGVPGMVLVIPALGMLKIICDRVPPLQPYGFLLGTEKKKGKKE
jgi:predicted PurR-regulated permease PerM